MKIIFWITFISLAASFCGCSSTVNYQQNYMAAKLFTVNEKFKGTALIVTHPREDNRVYSQKPSSFTGSATTLTAKLGEYVKKMSLDFFGKLFEGGAHHGSEIAQNSGYSLIIEPELIGFDYKYNQLQNLGFSITPEAKVEMLISLYGPDGEKVFENTYSSGYLDGETYMMSMNPSEKINQTIHDALFEILKSASIDIDRELRALESLKSDPLKS